MRNWPAFLLVGALTWCGAELRLQIGIYAAIFFVVMACAWEVRACVRRRRRRRYGCAHTRPGGCELPM